MAPRIPRRTREIELWDVNPIGNRAAWNREIAQFWALMLSRGRLVRTPPYLVKDNEYAGNSAIRGRVPTKRPLTVAELAALLTSRLAETPGVIISARELASIRRWLADAAIVPGERIRWLPELPAAALAIPHYGSLVVFNRGVTRLRYWAAFFYSALKSDLDYADVSGTRGGSGDLLDAFLADGLAVDPPLGVANTEITWSVEQGRLATRDPEVFLALAGLAAPASGVLPSIGSGMPRDWLAGATIGDTYSEFLCPGMVILGRRALRVLLGTAEDTSSSAMTELLETVLVNHAALYYIRGMRVLNDLTRGRKLPEDCANCWDRFQTDLRPDAVTSQEERWRQGDYGARGDVQDAAWVEDHCTNPRQVFLNAGRKEQQDAKDLARLSLDDLRQQLGEYTVNRIMLKICWDVARLAASPSRPEPTSVRDVLSYLDRWYGDSDTQLMLAALWRSKIAELALDKDVSGAVRENVEARLTSEDPTALEGMARYLVGETILSSRAFTRYVEVLNSLLGGGALPTNQDPKGLMARGGNQATRFHLSLNDRSLEGLVAIASREAGDNPLSFQDFIDFLRKRYGLLVDRKPEHLNVAPGLVADAAAQSREQLRSRLSSMGLLTEFSDSSDWNRVHWRTSS